MRLTYVPSINFMLSFMDVMCMSPMYKAILMTSSCDSLPGLSLADANVEPSIKKKVKLFVFCLLKIKQQCPMAEASFPSHLLSKEWTLEK